jgi:tetratricopeptide (TPR) repeat protein
MNDLSKCRPWILMLLVSACTLGAAAQETTAKSDKPVEAGGAAAATAPSSGPAITPSPELAQRYAALAQDTLRQKIVLPPHFKEAAALLMDACKLDPAEPRYPKMLYEAMLQIGDSDGALEALKAYRAIDLPGRSEQEQPRNDQLAMINYIDLSARRIETAEERFDFYKKLLDSRAPDPVKSHAAYRASQVALERGQNDLHDSFLGQALRLNPLNLDALRARLHALEQNGMPVERIGVMLSMLKSNPIQPEVTYNIAREIAEAGMADDAIMYYAQSWEIAGRAGQPMNREFWLGYASELYLTGKPQLLAGTRTIVDQLLKQNSGDVESLLLRWLADRIGSDKEALAKSQHEVLNAALNRVLTIRQQLGVAGATTRPVESTDAVSAPDLSADLNTLKDAKYEALRVPYAQAVSDLAWYLVYVGNQPAEASKLLATLKGILSDKDPLVVRIEGWIFMAQGQTDQASVKLKAVADQDVLAQAGTYLLWSKNPAEKDPAMSSARKLLKEHPSGLLAVLLSDVMRELNPKLLERDDAAAIRERLGQFPKDWLRIIDAPQNFYALTAGMVDGKVLFAYGEPMFARVYIKNISPYDITIGPEGVIKNDLWFDAQLRGLVQKTVTGAAYERLSHVLVLKAGQTVTQTVRLDQGQLGQILSGNPGPALTFFGHVRTNPRGNGGSGPGGYDVEFSPITERSGFGLTQNTLTALTTAVATGSPTEKIRGVELISAEVTQLRSLPDQTDQTKALVTGFVDTLQKSANDSTPAVATWSIFLTAIQDPNRRPAIIKALVSEPDPSRQVLGLLLANALPTEQQKQLALNAQAASKDESVQLYAQGMIDLAEMIAAHPTTAPTDAPAVPGVGGPIPIPAPAGVIDAPKQP